ncbi:MAG TPA: MFS transporter [Gemmataceae bacterium]|nr:MFS transporter [Gemmataceae bacterium]
MNLREFRKTGHWPSLLSAFLYFDTSFAIWVLIGALAVSISADFWPKPDGVTPEEHLRQIAPLQTLMMAVPLLGGSILRLVLGLMTDRIGARRTGLIGMSLTALPLLLGWLWATSLPQMLLVGLMLGVAGASFAAALPLASRWYPPERQGLAMGIAGAGNSGTALATFFGPMLAKAIGWHAVFALALAPLALTFLVFFLLAKDSPNQPPPKPLIDYGRVFGQADTWWFCLFYSMTFGGFVGLSSFLNAFFANQYFPADPKTGAVYAGWFTTLCVISGSFLRPVGGHLADRFGGVRMLLGLYLFAGAALAGMAFLPPLAGAIALLFAVMGLLGMGNGAVFQLVPLRFRKEVGVMTGVVGAAGGLGGFLLPNVLGGMKRLTGSYGIGFAVIAGISFLCLALLWRVKARWESTFVTQALHSAAASPAPAPASPAAVEPSLAVAPAVGGSN